MAEGPREAALKLRQMGLYPKELRESAPATKRLDAKELPGITQELALLLGSGLPLVEALKALARDAPGPWRALLESTAEDVASGLSLHRAMQQHPRAFPAFYVSMVEAGQLSGQLPQALRSLSRFLLEQERTKHSVQAALLYPAFMLAVGAAVLMFIFAFVLPRVVGLFEHAGASLPLPTRALILLSSLASGYWWAAGGLALLGAYGLRWLYRLRTLKAHSLLLRPPLLRSLYLSRFLRALSLLLQGGLPVAEALELSGSASGNLALKERAREAAERLKEGAELSQALQGGFPQVLVRLVHTGQQSGTLPQVLQEAADTYEQEATRRLQRAVALLEPTLILLMGSVVTFVVLGVLLPIFELNQLIR